MAMAINTSWLKDKINESSLHSSVEVFELSIKLQGTQRLIWRKVWAPCQLTLKELHVVIQSVMPWEDRHAEEFFIDGKKYIVSESTFEYNNDIVDTKSVKLSSILTKSSQFDYLYDMWKHKITVTDKFTVKLRNNIPICVAGENACSPEDVGGVEEFEKFLKVITDPLRPEGSSNISWSLGFHAERFSHLQANALIAYRFANIEMAEF